MPDGIKTIADANAWHKAQRRQVARRDPTPTTRSSPTTGSSAARTCVDTYNPDLALLRRHRTALRAVRPRHRRPLLQLQHPRQGPPRRRRHRQRPQARPRRRHHPRHRTRQGPGHPRRPLADRHLHRRLALQHRTLREPQVQDAEVRHPLAHRHRQQERQPDAEHPASRATAPSTPTSAPSSRPSPPGSPNTAKPSTAPAPSPSSAKARQTSPTTATSTRATSARTRPKTSASHQRAKRSTPSRSCGRPTASCVIKTLARGSAALPKPIQRVELIGGRPVTFAQEPSGLTLTLPEKAPNEYAYAFIIRT